MTPLDRLKAKVVVSDSGCWEWQASLSGRGYGLFWFEGKLWQAHRASYKIHHGDPGEVVMHSCDNTRCVNPEHLESGTQVDNIADRDRKGRRHPNQRGGIIRGKTR
ncbi:hypothetical protein [Ralstonia phage p2106]|uniref:HNH nuclease domain-containing protein n=1 Tax=Ralstonia phage p2106 TaxID=2998497 RepID=A0AAF0AJ65_9CAUD|nr:hypothetical protein [Ralstonia phage p2106]